MPHYNIESMQRWSGDPRTLAMHHLVHKLRVEIEVQRVVLLVRTSNPGCPSQPEEFRSPTDVGDAYDFGYDCGWRDQWQKFNDVYTGRKHRRACKAGYQQGLKESGGEITRICAEKFSTAAA